jgi:KipI family sensor histidine kinase inhibitor
VTTQGVYSEPRIAWAGDAALVIEFGDSIDETVNRRVHWLAHALEQAAIGGVVDLVPTYRSLLICYDPRQIAFAGLDAAVRRLLAASGDGAAAEPRTVAIPTCYGGEYGPDLGFVAGHAQLPPEEVVRLHAAGRYTVFMMGFSPGFAYLGGMAPQIAAPRLKTPRTAIPAGSVGIAQQQTGIYPIESPGGWQLIGRTPVRLFDARRTPPTALEPGDTIRFVPIDEEQYRELEKRAESPDVQGSWPQSIEARPARPVSPTLEIINGGGLTTVQDLGRYGFQRYGVPVSGSMDAFALRVANLLVGNDENAAALEMTITGAEILFERTTVVAVAGADLQPRVDDQVAPMWRAFLVPAGATLTFRGRRAGARACLAVAGGIDVPAVLGSRSTYVRSHLGGFEGRTLRPGDRVPLGRAGDQEPRGRELPASWLPEYLAGHRVRVILGPQEAAFTSRGVRTFLSSAYTIAPQSDRMGYRLDGPRVEHRASADIVSDGTPAGAVQVPGDGMPLVLLADRGTTGGYPKIATVITADLPRLAQCREGDRLFFDAVTEREARAALERQELVLARLREMPLSPLVDVAPATAAHLRPGAPHQHGLGPAAIGRLAVRAPLPGKVLEVLVRPGETVERGQTLCVLEAMKMHNAIVASRPGRVAQVRAAVGDRVRDGDTLVDIE